MALWLVRAGKYGEHEAYFIGNNRICLTWGELAEKRLAESDDFESLKRIVAEVQPAFSPVQVGVAAGQFRAFMQTMRSGDLIAVPRKQKPALAFGQITSGPKYDASAEPQYRHYRDVKWLNTDVPRSALDQDLLYSFGSLLTISQPRLADAESRVRELEANGWKPLKPKALPSNGGDDSRDDTTHDLEQLGRDAIARTIIRRFKGKRMELLVAAILKAQGYATYVSPDGADKGVDILAAPGPLGFGRPRLCVQVKSTDSPIDHPTLSQLIGTMQNVQAEQGLLVSWGGFKSTVEKETPNQFFRVRFWGQKELIDELLEHYHKLDEEIRAELPLKRIWTVAETDSDT